MHPSSSTWSAPDREVDDEEYDDEEYDGDEDSDFGVGDEWEEVDIPIKPAFDKRSSEDTEVMFVPNFRNGASGDTAVGSNDEEDPSTEPFIEEEEDTEDDIVDYDSEEEEDWEDARRCAGSRNEAGKY